MNKLSLLLIPAASVPLLLAPEDHETIPAEATRVESRLAEQKLKLPDAVELIATVGQVLDASIDPEGGQIYATVYGGQKAWHVVMDQDGTITRKDEIPRFPGWGVTGVWTETASGLKYYDIKIGQGPTPPASDSTVKVHYTGYLTNGQKFDSSVDRNQPATFPLNRVIPGWTEGVGSMTVGSKRKLIIPYGQAYGASGRPPTIPPKATLIFDVELIEIVN